MRLTIILCFFCISSILGQNPLFQDLTMSGGTAFGSENNNGVVVGDFDNDGFEDLFVTSRTDANRLYKNMGNGTFQDVTDKAQIETGGLTMTAVWGDVDNDGDIDLFVGNYYIPTEQYSNYLYRNDGNGFFTDISSSAGIDRSSQTRSVHMVDIDQDGFLDIYVCNLLQQNVYWRNNGDNTFTNNIFFSGLVDSSISMGAVFFDYDNDGDQDVYLIHDGNQQYIMYENDGTGRFTDVSVQTGLNVAGQGMGIDFADINNDGHLDIYVTNLGPSFLLLNDGTGKYTEIAESAGVTDISGMSWGCFFFDYNNDGWEDLYVVNDSNFSPSPNKLFRNNKDNTFSNVSENDPTLSSFYAGRSGNWADFNNDGLRDIVIANGQNFRSVEIIENTDDENNWIGFEVKGVTVAADAFGTRIELTTDNGIKIDEKTGGSSYASQSSHRIYFGLGQGEAIDISVQWTDGSVDFFPSLAINQIHTITQGMSNIIRDQDGDGFNADEDCDDTNADVNPDMVEVAYNGLDDDCNPLTPDDDIDGDGYPIMDDCDDNNNEIYPGQAEFPYNGLDDDCNAQTPDDDLDGDGYLQIDDCDDNNAAINPGLTEVAYNGLDDDCDALTLDDDLDQDGYIMANDCDDDNPEVNPDQTEIVYNGLDDDCNNLTLDDDLDEDGYTLDEDCDDENAAINPAAEEIVNNGIDEDCDGADLTSSTSVFSEDNRTSIFPNPASNYIIVSQRGSRLIELRMYNSAGQLVLSSKKLGRIDISKLKAGVYFIKTVETNSGAFQLAKVIVL